MLEWWKNEQRARQQIRRNCITKARKLENTKKGKGVYETLLFRAFIPRQNNGGQVSCFRDGFASKLLCLDSAFAFGLRDDS
jgi:hypothetical protein